MMSDAQRTVPPVSGSEKEMLIGYLNLQRDTLLWKLDGLDDEQLRRRHEPSGLSLLGLAKHLTDVERTWFLDRFAGEIEPETWNPKRYWRIEPDEAATDLIAGYRAACEMSDRIVGEHALDDSAARTPPHRAGLTLGWILIHMVQETARHVGHADLIREAIDGRTGT